MDAKLNLLLQACKPSDYEDLRLSGSMQDNCLATAITPNDKSFMQKVSETQMLMENMNSLYNSLPNYLSLAADMSNYNAGKNYLTNAVQALPLVQLGPGGPIGSILQTHVFRPLTMCSGDSVNFGMIAGSDCSSDYGRIAPGCKSVSSAASPSAFSAFSPIISEPKSSKETNGKMNSVMYADSSNAPSTPSSLPNSIHIPMVASPYLMGNSASSASCGFKNSSTSPLIYPFSSASVPSFPGSMSSLADMKKPTTIHAGKIKRLKRKDKVHTCEHGGCGFSFPTRFSLKRHQKRHTGEKPFLCNWVENGEPCGTRFAEKSTLKRHLQTHTGEKPFKCSRPGCDRVFADRLNCHRHERRHRSAWIPTSQL